MNAQIENIKGLIMQDNLDHGEIARLRQQIRDLENARAQLPLENPQLQSLTADVAKLTDQNVNVQYAVNNLRGDIKSYKLTVSERTCLRALRQDYAATNMNIQGLNKRIGVLEEALKRI